MEIENSYVNEVKNWFGSGCQRLMRLKWKEVNEGYSQAGHKRGEQAERKY